MNKQILHFAWPIFSELAIQTAMQLVDAINLGKVSDSAIGVVSSLNTIFNLSLMIFLAWSQAGGICISIALGAKKLDETAKFRFLIIALSLLLSLPVAVGIFYFSTTSLRWPFFFSSSQVEYAQAYLSIAAWQVIAQSIIISLHAFLRSAGKAKWILPGAILGNGCNAILASYLIAHQQGVRGVAWALLSGQMVMIICAMVAVFGVLKQPLIRPQRLELLPKYLVPMVKIFFPIVVELVAFHFSQLLMAVVISNIGPEAMAARGYAVSLYAFALLGSLSLGQCAQFFVGHELGKLQREQASKFLTSCLQMAWILGLGLTLLIAILSPWALMVFTSNPEVIWQAQWMLWIAFLTEVGKGTNIVVVSGLRAAKSASFSAKIGIIFMLGMAVPLAWTLGIYWELGIIGVGIALGLDELIRGYLNYQRWQKICGGS